MTIGRSATRSRDILGTVWPRILMMVTAALMPFAVSCGASGTAAGNGNSMTNSEQNMQIPSPVKEFVEAVNAGDEAKFLSFFDEGTGVINDWGRIFTGHAEIKKWSDKEFIGAKGTITPQRVETKDDEISLWAGWKSNYYSGDSKFVFVVDGDSIKEMRIESAK